MNLYEALQEDHHRLAAHLDELLNYTHVNDAAGMDAAWAKLERGLLAHLTAEETWMLPVFERENLVMAEKVREDHARIRALLADLGVGIELHVVREPAIEELAEFLRLHASREEVSLYRWAHESLDKGAAHDVLERLRTTLARRGRPDFEGALSEAPR